MFMPNHRAAAALLLALALPCPVFAQSQAELNDIRKQIQEVKESYERRLQALEQRLKDAESTAANAQQQAREAEAAAANAQKQAAEAQTAAAPQAGAQGSASGFNPSISVVLMGTYANLSQSPDAYGVTGFASPGQISPGSRGFSLDESEVAFSANIDQLFYGNLLLSFNGDSVETEEAYFQTLALGYGLTLKGGRFFSGIGYQNSVHAHAWDFDDSALMQRTFLGNNYGDVGVQATWVAPTPFFLQLGGELGAGTSLPGNFDGDTELLEIDRNKNGIGAWTLFVKFGGDVGPSNSYQLGASYLKSSTGPDSPTLADFDTRLPGVTTAWHGNAEIYGLDAVWKWAPNGNATDRNFKLVAEWMQLKRDGNLASDGPAGPQEDGFDMSQYGWYVQGVYQFMPEWRIGARYDRLDWGSFSGGTNDANLSDSDYNPWRLSAMADWSPSEFSRIRLQYNYDKSQQDVTDHQIFLQYIFSLGAHGAHKF